MITFNKHVKWRVDLQALFICNCKKLLDFKLPLTYEPFLRKLDRGIIKDNLTESEKIVISDFEKMNLLSNLKIRNLTKKDFLDAMNLLTQEIPERPRSNTFLYNKFKKFPQFFVGLFLDSQLIGVICGFPREDYLLISELAVDSKFQKRGFGKILISAFEKTGKDYKKINVGALDKFLDFYSSVGYSPFLLIQFKKEFNSLEDFKKFNIINQKKIKGYIILEVKIDNYNLEFLNKLRKKYPKAYFQYIFTK